MTSPLDHAVRCAKLPIRVTYFPAIQTWLIEGDGKSGPLSIIAGTVDDARTEYLRIRDRMMAE